MRKNLLTLLMAAWTALHAPAAPAHGDTKPRHGGIVQIAHDLSFELVVESNEVAIYIEDHEKAVAVVGASGKLSVLNGAARSDAELTPSGDKLAAKGVQLSPGSKVVASVTLAGKPPVSLRFAVK